MWQEPGTRAIPGNRCSEECESMETVKILNILKCETSIQSLPHRSTAKPALTDRDMLVACWHSIKIEV